MIQSKFSFLTYLQVVSIIALAFHTSCNGTKLTIGFLSSCNIKCGIASYTNHHIQALSRLGHQVLCYSSNQPPSLLLVQMQKDKISILHIQYEPGLYQTYYAPAQLINFIKNAQQSGIKIVITMHKEDQNTVAIAEAADARIYHKPSQYIASSKPYIFVVPHGVPVFIPSLNRNALRKKYGFSHNDIILTCFGFLEPSKEHATILKALVPLIKSNQNYRIQLLTSLNDHFLETSKNEAIKIKKVIERYKLKKQVVHITEFLPQHEISERLYLSDLGYLWINHNTQSSSGAFKEFIAAKLPLVCPNSTHYYDSPAGIIKTPLDKKKFISKIQSMLSNQELLTSLKKQLNSYYNEFNYDTLIKKHLQIYASILA